MTAQEFADLYHRHYGLLYFLLLDRAKNRELAEDMAAQAFAQAWDHRDALRDPAKFKPWLYAIAMNDLCRVQRAFKLDPLETEEVNHGETLADPRDFATELEKRESWRRVRAALRRLSEVERYAVRCVARGMDQREAAQAQGIPQGTVGTRLMNARKRLAAICGKEVT